jgi:hypothetical protein
LLFYPLSTQYLNWQLQFLSSTRNLPKTIFLIQYWLHGYYNNIGINYNQRENDFFLTP